MLSRILSCALLSLTVCFGANAADAPSSTAATEAAPVIRFDVLEFRIEGNSVLDDIEIERAVIPHLGPGRSVTDVEAARANLERTYHEAGYLTVFVDIPEQDVRGGVVTLKVTEATVNRLRVKGTKYFSAGRIRDVAAAVAEGAVPYFPNVQADIQRLQRTQDRRVTPVLRQAPIPGRVDVDLNVEDKLPVHGSVEINNRYTANTEPLRLSVAMRYDNLWQREHSIGAQVLTAPEDPSQVRVFSGNYLFRPGDGDKLLALYGVLSRSDVAAASNLNLVGRGKIAGARYIIPLPTRGSTTHSVTLGVDYKDFTDGLVLLGSDTLNTPISYVPVSAQYSYTHRGAKGVTQASASMNFAPRDLLGNNDAEFRNRRFNAHANYAYARAEISREQLLPRGFTVYGRFGGQSASGPLVSTEQFFAGGVDTVRGYLESEALGDNGINGRLELRSPMFTPAVAGMTTELTALGFFDAAELTVIDALPGQLARVRISSTGVGLRAKGGRSLSASLDVGRALQSARSTSAGDTRLQFRLAYDF